MLYVLAVAAFTLMQPGGPIGPPVAHALVIQACGTHCGTERWAVKTFTDTDTGCVDGRPTVATVAELRQLHAPPRDSLPEAGRIPPLETHAYVVQAVLVGWKLEADSDLHLRTAQPANRRAA